MLQFISVDLCDADFISTFILIQIDLHAECFMPWFHVDAPMFHAVQLKHWHMQPPLESD